MVEPTIKSRSLNPLTILFLVKSVLHMNMEQTSRKDFFLSLSIFSLFLFVSHSYNSFANHSLHQHSLTWVENGREAVELRDQHVPLKINTLSMNPRII